MSSARTARLSSCDQEAAIWQEVVLGSRAAFMQLLGLSLRPMLSYYFRSIPAHLRHQIDPYDLRQKACVEIVRGYTRFHPATLAAYHAWRKCIQRRVLALALREAGAHEEGCSQRPCRLDECAIETGRQRAFDPGYRSTLDTIILAETSSHLQAFVDQLPDADRQLFLWRARDHVSFAEIARRLEIARGHAWRRYRQICRRLSTHPSSAGTAPACAP